MTKSELDTAIDDGRRKTGTTFISTDEKTRYENLALQDISRNADLYEQDAVSDFTYTLPSGTYAINALSAVCPNLKETEAIISISQLSSTTVFFNRVRPEDFEHLTYGNFFAQSGRDLWVMSTSKDGDTLRVRYVSNYVARTSGGTLQSSLSSATDTTLNDVDPEAIIEFVLWKVFRKEGKSEDAKDAHNRYLELLKNIVQNNSYHRAGIYDRVTIEGGWNTDWTNRIR